MAHRIRTLIVDDSALVRKIVTESLARFPDIEVVGSAMDPYIARDKILSLNPDVITLDIEMPRMDGITFLKLIMKHRPMPVIIMSSLTTAGSAKALEALQAGAVDVLSKPSGSFSSSEDGHALADKIRAAAQARISKTSQTESPAPAPKISAAPPPRAISRPSTPLLSKKLVVIGASTGGTEALKTVLTRLSGDLPPICIVQHIPAFFSLAFANRLNELCNFEVREAKSGDAATPGVALIAPGGFHMLLQRNGAGLTVETNTGPKLHYQRPAVDVLFDSAVKIGAASSTLGILLTGMGADGAAGLLRLREEGASTIAQNEESCVVFGMPREAIRLGAAQAVLSLEEIANRIQRFAAAPVAS